MKEQTPNNKETKRMLSIAIEIAIKHIMKTHIYEFEGELKRQLNIKMYKRYVDDINIVLEIPTVEGNIESNKKEEDITITTMNKVKEIGGTIHNSIKLQLDTPALNNDHKMPILDLKVWCEKRKITTSNKTIIKNVVLHEFYAKPMSAKNVMHARTAMPTQMKKTALTQEMLRVLLRCSPLLEKKEVNKHCSELNKRMQFSGHNIKFRTFITKSAIKAYKEIERKDRENIEPHS